MSSEIKVKKESDLVVDSPPDLMSSVQAMAADESINLDRLQKVFDMAMQHQRAEAEKLYNLSMAMAQSEMVVVAKNKKNDKAGRYADLQAIHATCKPIWTKNGFSVVTCSKKSELDAHVHIVTDVLHSGGHRERFSDDWPLDGAGLRGNSNKTPIQAKASTVTYARRYTELMIFDIVTGDDNDGNSQSSSKADMARQPISMAQVAAIKKALSDSGLNEEWLLLQAGVGSIDAMSVGNFDGWLNHVKSQTPQ